MNKEFNFGFDFGYIECDMCKEVIENGHKIEIVYEGVIVSTYCKGCKEAMNRQEKINEILK